jgi:hypothetical protein
MHGMMLARQNANMELNVVFVQKNEEAFVHAATRAACSYYNVQVLQILSSQAGMH